MGQNYLTADDKYSIRVIGDKFKTVRVFNQSIMSDWQKFIAKFNPTTDFAYFEGLAYFISRVEIYAKKQKSVVTFIPEYGKFLNVLNSYFDKLSEFSMQNLDDSTQKHFYRTFAYMFDDIFGQYNRLSLQRTRFLIRIFLPIILWGIDDKHFDSEVKKLVYKYAKSIYDKIIAFCQANCEFDCCDKLAAFLHHNKFKMFIE